MKKKRKIDYLWSSHYEEIAEAINEQTKSILNYMEQNKDSFTKLNDLIGEIYRVCDFWVGGTYVGRKKDERVKVAFQNFFEAFYKLLLYLKERDTLFYKDFAERILYRGKVYRYLGDGVPGQSSRKRVNVQYNNTYVSWSKLKKIPYIEEKLYGEITWLAAEIKSPYYGIDLEEFGCSRPHEKEVVFPTIEDCVTKIKYIGEPDE